MTAPLDERACVPCKGGVPPLAEDTISGLLQQVHEGWAVVDGHHLQRRFAFSNFADALAFTNRVGAVAEAEGHHPDIFLTWGKVRIEIWTHAIDGLTESDFILAAKIDRLA
ncbi:MAG TPA: 4a-hydroxytetrahydrobiopterin dehydratase [Gemmatimonadales bacterium]